MADSDKRRKDKRRWIARVRAMRRRAGLCVQCGAPVKLEPPAAVKRGRGRPRTGATCDRCLGRVRGETIADIERRIEAVERLLRR